ncbi:MAG: thrombospondin type 3 repeat-containing protein, partial [Verrucomicrobiae bacterium]|nr:thrombospondin type 3 repeat-containing protein [Verrucomicrobiae bacterium]
ADISYWHLTDDFRNPFKYRIRPGTVIPPHGILVIDAREFGSGPTGFGLSAYGDELFLFSGDQSGNLTGYCHGFAFGASPPGSTIGTYLASDGSELVMLESEPSIGRFNTGPRISPVLISEVMVETGSTNRITTNHLQYIELCNSSSNEVQCFNANHPERTWVLRGTVEFDFPVGLALAPGEIILIVPFDPVAEPGLLAEFRRLYNLNLKTRIFGPWRAAQPASEKPVVRLFEPGDPIPEGRDRTGQVPYYVLDELRLNRGLPGLDQSNGANRSVGRRSLRIFGNDPAAWVLCRPSPGVIDTDGDGLPDEWEIRYGLNPSRGSGDDGPDGDPDRDGLSNEQEYRSGTEPWPGPVHIECRAIPGPEPKIELKFVAVPFRTTKLLRAAAPNAASWQTVMTVSPGLERTTNCCIESATESSGYFRLEVE